MHYFVFKFGDIIEPQIHGLMSKNINCKFPNPLSKLLNAYIQDTTSLVILRVLLDTNSCWKNLMLVMFKKQCEWILSS